MKRPISSKFPDIVHFRQSANRTKEPSFQCRNEHDDREKMRKKRCKRFEARLGDSIGTPRQNDSTENERSTNRSPNKISNQGTQQKRRHSFWNTRLPWPACSNIGTIWDVHFCCRWSPAIFSHRECWCFKMIFLSLEILDDQDQKPDLWRVFKDPGSDYSTVMEEFLVKRHDLIVEVEKAMTSETHYWGEEGKSYGSCAHDHIESDGKLLD
jgi:hypothetical protein